MNNALQKLKNASPALLSAAAACGVISTAVLTADETPRAVKLLEEARAKKDDELTVKETVLAAAPAYIPAAISCVLTVTCIFGANVLNKRKQAALSGAYALLNESYRQYKGKVTEICGKETHDKIMRELAVEKTDDTHIYTPDPIFGAPTSLEFDGADEEKRLFYDSFSDRYFESTISRVLIAEHALNRNAMLSMIPSLNDFYELLGLEKTEQGDKTGWSFETGEYMWIDFNHILTTVDDGLPCWIIECSPMCEPAFDYSEHA